MRDSRFGEIVRRLYARYDRVMEKQGFYIVLGVCVLVIALSAIYTFSLRAEPDEVVATEEAQSAAGMESAQTLIEAQELIQSQAASEPLAVPSESLFRFTQPLDGITDRGFDDAEPQYFAQSNTWQVHLGIDLMAEAGTVVAACAPGKVKSVGEDGELGLCVLIDHENGYESLYAGLSSASYVKAGDPVARGQTIGHVGNGVLSESDAQSHLHLEARQNGRPIDPLNLFLGVDK